MAKKRVLLRLGFSLDVLVLAGFLECGHAQIDDPLVFLPGFLELCLGALAERFRLKLGGSYAVNLFA